MNNKQSKTTDVGRRSGLFLMASLIGRIKPLLPVMLLAIFLGVCGYLCAIFLTIFGACQLLRLVLGEAAAELAVLSIFSSKGMYVLLVVLAVARGLLHYGEQYCNHYIAFRLLALLRHQLFAKLRSLCPAKLEGKEKGNLISLITTDIELLEVFYAHTISPIAIAVVVSAIMTGYVGHFSVAAGLLALAGYVVVGICLPLLFGRRGAATGMAYRTDMGSLNSFLLDSLRGLDETIQYGGGRARLASLLEKSDRLGQQQKRLNYIEGLQRAVTTLAILGFSFAMLFLGLHLQSAGDMRFCGVLCCVVAMMGSFGPVVALANLSNTLNQTLSAAERLLALLEEAPKVEEVEGKTTVDFSGAALSDVSFSYEEEQILKDFSLEIHKGGFLGICGPSGCGKSTVLKLLMRFWDADEGKVSISGRDVGSVNTENLRELQGYMTQESWIFHDTLANNIALGKKGATREEVVAAAKKAAIHDFIVSLPKGYDTEVGELGDTLSGGERQRIGLARVFLKDAPLWLLDEPTSNLDALNEGMIQKSLQEARGTHTLVLISHRASTLNQADVLYKMAHFRKS